MIAIVDYGMGNVRSLMNAFEYFGEDAIITKDEDELREADRIVLPGVGAFGDAIEAIRQQGLEDLLNELALVEKKPMLGICLGMQLFAKSSVEHGQHKGLGWLDADIETIKVDRPLKVPHVGWNNISYPEDDWLFEGLPKGQANFYFVHSFHMVCHNNSQLLATVDYGSPVTAIARHENLLAIQFHPEKSQDNGLRLLQNWVEKEY